MELSGFEVRPCRSGMAFDVLPKKKGPPMDLAAAAEGLRARGFLVEAETPAVLVVRAQGKPVSVYADGKLQVKQTRDLAEARAVAGAVLACL